MRGAVLLVAAAAGFPLAVPADAARAPARLQVVAKEYSFALSRRKLKAGKVIIELANFGEDAHDLRLKRVGGTHISKIGVVQPGEVADLETTLRAGRYVLWCSLPHHRKRGMHAVLVVTRVR